jgi:asparagine synthase (glutamine-hydrolysing)
MSGFGGWFGLTRDAGGEAAIGAMAAALNRFSRAPVRSACAPFGAVASAGAPGSADVYEGDGRLVAVWGRASLGSAHLAELARREGPARALAAGYERERSEILRELHGSFAVAILDQRHDEALLATDRMGTRPVCYAASGDRIVFASTLAAIDACPGTGGRDRPSVDL